MAAFSGTVMKSVAGLSAILCLLLVAQSKAAPIDAKRTCPADLYWDHGTEKCEHCCDICCHANVKRTYEDCQSYCPAYAKKLADDKADVEKPELSPVDNPGKKPPDDSGGTSTANPGLIVGIVTAALVCSAGVLVALVYRIHKHMRTDGQTPLPTEEQPEDAEPEHEPEPETPGDRPVEEEGQEGPSEGTSSWRLLSPAEPRHAQETSSGQRGPFAMALLGMYTISMAGTFEINIEEIADSDSDNFGSNGHVTPKETRAPIYRGPPTLATSCTTSRV
ncbi:hypothetical protein BaRGS_00019653 [Batillaria attramentaria]|uniref:TNFR-Cys domain-containing protein n=1 Tax=Batillaria attramentaria TaxID=370345 RepID=A0ABD0KPU1_9CAEN